jgi:hypothetical protein
MRIISILVLIIICQTEDRTSRCAMQNKQTSHITHQTKSLQDLRILIRTRKPKPRTVIVETMGIPDTQGHHAAQLRVIVHPNIRKLVLRQGVQISSEAIFVHGQLLQVASRVCHLLWNGTVQSVVLQNAARVPRVSARTTFTTVTQGRTSNLSTSSHQHNVHAIASSATTPSGQTREGSGLPRPALPCLHPCSALQS